MHGARLVPNRPRYVILCNFDQFRVYDFETQMDAPVDTLPIAELPTRWGPLAFLFPGDHKPTFNNDRVAVTREAADALATCFKRLVRPDRSLCSPARARHPSPQLVNPLSKLRRRSGRMGLAMPQPRNMLAPMDVSTYNCIKSFLRHPYLEAPRPRLVGVNGAKGITRLAPLNRPIYRLCANDSDRKCPSINE
jgi:hypothetical protein